LTAATPDPGGAVQGGAGRTVRPVLAGEMEALKRSLDSVSARKKKAAKVATIRQAAPKRQRA
jgi:hypothetical protein